METPTLEVWKLELARLMVGVPIVGFFCNKSCRLVAPDAAISTEFNICNGDGDSAAGEAIREPVISTFCMGSAVSWLSAVCAPNARPAMHNRRIERAIVVSLFIIIRLLGCVTVILKCHR
ncbi:hypothetical protein L1274_006164 [Duganella sp. HSC-15S17]|uniref:Uncharacterized protein n=1 Tax=Duganella violaceipulchra TaxID=2849652 RepID=A0ABT1GUD5_9BURK|nr:hypothetical protein [Duganella violaceicalia]